MHADPNSPVSIRRYKVSFITNLPSPYQRDLFRALATRDDIDLSVYYMDERSPENPWPEKPMRPFEKIMPGFWLPLVGRRTYVNWTLPNISEPRIVVLSGYTSVTAQWLMRGGLRGKCWLFWGERLRRHSGVKALIQRGLAAPISHASGVVGIGRAAEEDYHRRFPKLPHFCIPYHCDLSSFFRIRRHTEASTATTFFFCGQMIRRKGVDLLLMAFDRTRCKRTERILTTGRARGRSSNFPIEGQP